MDRDEASEALDHFPEYHWLTRSDATWFTVVQVAKHAKVSKPTILGWLAHIEGATMVSQQAGWKIPRSGLLLFFAARVKGNAAMPALESGTITTVALDAIGGDIWPTDPNIVESMRATLQEGRPLPRVSLNHRADGVYEVIDGFHRYDALKAEEVPVHTCDVFEQLPEREVMLRRVSATYQKPSDIVRQRAVKALREGFVRDIATVVQGVSEWMEPQIGEDGEVHAMRRMLPLSADPVLALQVIEDHVYVTHDDEALWIKAVTAWQEEIGKRLHLTQAELRDKILGLSAMEEEGLISGKQPERRARALRNIRDNQIRDLVKRKMKAERNIQDFDIELALDWLGCGINQYQAPWFHHRPKREQIQMLNKSSLVDLAAAYRAEVRSLEEQQLAALHVIKPESPHVEKPDDFDPIPGMTMSKKFGQSTEVKITYGRAHELVAALLDTIHRLDRQDTTWRESELAKHDWQSIRTAWESE